jgi:hypothetical protein
MFGVPFEEIGQIIGRSTDAAKMLASRARRTVQGTRRPAGVRHEQRAVVDIVSVTHPEHLAATHLLVTLGSEG